MYVNLHISTHYSSGAGGRRFTSGSGSGALRSGRRGRPGTGGQSGHSANSGDSLADDDDDM